MGLLLLLFVPALIGLVGLLLGRGKINWKEFLIQEGIVIVVIFAGFGIGSWSRTADTEIWSGVIASKEMQHTICCHTYPCNCHEVCSGSGEDRSCHEECDTCRQHNHDEAYSALTSNGEVAYSDTCNKPGSKEPKRYAEIKVGEPTAIEHPYTNYIKGNPDTILKRTVDLEKFNGVLPPYPRVFDWYRAERFIFKVSSATGTRQADWNTALAEANGRIGAAKQVSLIVLVTDSPDVSYIEALKREWIGGKKNDFVVILGTPHYPEISWAGVVSWSKSEDAKLAVRDRILALKQFDGEEIVKIIEEEVSAKYVRREMKDFEYLKASIEPSGAVQTILFIIGVLLSTGLTIYFWRHDPLDV